MNKIEDWSLLSEEAKRAWATRVRSRDERLARFTIEELLSYKELQEECGRWERQLELGEQEVSSCQERLLELASEVT